MKIFEILKEVDKETDSEEQEDCNILHLRYSWDLNSRPLCSRVISQGICAMFWKEKENVLEWDTIPTVP